MPYNFRVHFSGKSNKNHLTMNMLRSITWLLIAGLIALSNGCEDDDDGNGDSSGDFGENDPSVVVALGDSITAGYPGGLTPYPALLSTMTGKWVVNAGVSGDMTADGAGRVGGLLSRYKPGYLIVLLGANDAIHNVDPDDSVANLRRIINAARDRKTRPIVGTVLNMYGDHAAYQPRVDALNQKIRQMCSSENVRCVDLSGASSSRDYFTADGLHPNQLGHQKIAEAFAGAL